MLNLNLNIKCFVGLTILIQLFAIKDRQVKDLKLLVILQGGIVT
jgi:hypothetical protein